MFPTRRETERSSLLVAASFDEDDDVSEVLLDAFLSTRVDVFEKERTLQDRIDGDVLDGIDWADTGTVVLTFEIWGHRVEVRPGTVEIYRILAGDPPRGESR